MSLLYGQNFERVPYEPCKAIEAKKGLAIATVTKGLGRLSVVFFAILYTYYELKDSLSRGDLGDFRRLDKREK